MPDPEWEPESGRLSRFREGSGVTWLLAPPLVFFLVALVVPLFFVFRTALVDSGWSGSLEAVTGELFVSAVERTLLMAAVVATLSSALGLVYSVAIAVAGGRMRMLLLGLVLMSFSISLLVRTYGWVLLYQPYGLLHDLLSWIGLSDAPVNLWKTTVAMYPAMVHIMLPFTILPLYSAVAALDVDQLKAAQSLGAHPNLLIRRVLLPQLRGGLAAGWLLVFILSLGFFVTPAVIGGPNNLMIATVIDQQFSWLFHFGSASAMGAAVLIVVLVIYVLADRLLAHAIGWQGD